MASGTNKYKRAVNSVLKDTRTLEFLNKLRDPDPGIRYSALDGLERIKKLTPTIVPKLIKQLEDNEKRVRGRIVELLGEIGTPGAISGIKRALEDVDPDVRVSAINAYIDCVKDKKKVFLLLSKTLEEDCDADIREEIVMLADKIGREEGISLITRAMRDSVPRVRQLAISIGGKFGKPVMPSLVEALHDQSEEVKETAKIELIRRKSHIDKQTVSALVRLYSECKEAREGILDVLHAVGDRSALTATRMIENPTNFVKHELLFSSSSVVPALEKKLLP